MAYDEGLAERLRDALADTAGVAEKKMFGGLAFMVRGNMCCGVVGEELMVRVGPDDTDRHVAICWPCDLGQGNGQGRQGRLVVLACQARRRRA